MPVANGCADVLDHLVIGHERWVSLARRGALLNRGAVADFRDERSDVLPVPNVLQR